MNGAHGLIQDCLRQLEQLLSSVVFQDLLSPWLWSWYVFLYFKLVCKQSCLVNSHHYLTKETERAFWCCGWSMAVRRWTGMLKQVVLKKGALLLLVLKYVLQYSLSMAFYGLVWWWWLETVFDFLPGFLKSSSWAQTTNSERCWFKTEHLFLWLFFKPTAGGIGVRFELWPVCACVVGLMFYAVPFSCWKFPLMHRTNVRKTLVLGRATCSFGQEHRVVFDKRDTSYLYPTLTTIISSLVLGQRRLSWRLPLGPMTTSHLLRWTQQSPD